MERRRNVATRPKPAGVLLLQIAAATAAAVRVYPAACSTDRSDGSRLTESYPTCAQAPPPFSTRVRSSRCGIRIHKTVELVTKLHRLATCQFRARTVPHEARCIGRGMPDGRPTTVDSCSRANPCAAASSSISYLGRATVSDCRS
jgi:hypothetical protein